MERPRRLIRDLPFVIRDVLHVKPDDSIGDAASIMLLNDFSQLPVLDKQKAVGILRWPTMLKGALDKHQEVSKTPVRHWMTAARTVRDDHQIYEAFTEVLQHEYVLIVGDDETVCGIITPYDLTLFANKVLVPYLLIEVAEWGLRDLTERAQMEGSKRQKLPSSKQADKEWMIGLPEIIGILNHRDNWNKLQTALSQPIVIGAIEQMRLIRNKLMHFAVGSGLSSDDRQSIDLLVRFLDQVRLDGPQKPTTT